MNNFVCSHEWCICKKCKFRQYCEPEQCQECSFSNVGHNAIYEQATDICENFKEV